jgi:hypothetical protein
MQNYFKRMFAPKKPKFLFTTKNMARHTGNGDRIMPAGGANISGEGTLMDLAFTYTSVGDAAKPEDTRKAVEPKAVFEELKNEKTPDVSFDNLPAKIKSVEDRLKILKEHLSEDHLMDEHRTLFYLKNRQKYLSTQKKNPLDWATTTQGAVEDLCKRYKLKVVPLKQYYTLVPNEALKEMDRYTKAYKAITGDKPIFELVIKDADALKPEEKKEVRKKDRDPILLANSPLSNSLFIIGAWDEEIEFVDEIIYEAK